MNRNVSEVAATTNLELIGDDLTAGRGRKRVCGVFISGPSAHDILLRILAYGGDRNWPFLFLGVRKVVSFITRREVSVGVIIPRSPPSLCLHFCSIKFLVVEIDEKPQQSFAIPQVYRTPVINKRTASLKTTRQP